MEKSQLRRARHTTEEKQEILGAWKASGLRAQEFAKQARVGHSTLFKWRRELAQHPATGTPFLPVRVRQGEHSNAVKITSVSGLSIEVNGSSDPEAVRVALRAVLACG